MFASATFGSQRQAGAYRQMHVASGIEGASPHRLIEMLYDGFVDAVAEARGAIRARNVAQKGRAIRRAIGIVDDGLRGALNLEAGGPMAADLNELYSYITLRLTQANLHNDETALEECSRLIEPLRSAWNEIADRVPA